LDSCEFNPFQMFCQFQTYNKRYGRVMKIIWDINTVFLPVLFKIIKAWENLSSRNLFVCNNPKVSNIIFFVKIRSNFVYLCTHICKNRFINFLFSYVSKFAADICSNVVAVVFLLYYFIAYWQFFVIELFCSI
jgi:hypothetical protein